MTPAHAAPGEGRPPPPGFAEALRFWLKLGFVSFGGPAGQIAIMHAELVERRRWISERRFLHALNYCMLLPGPEAQQLATYLGWLMHRTAGWLAAGLLFVLPSLLILLLLSWVYMAFGEQRWVAAAFAGVKPAVVAIVIHAAWRIGARTLHNGLLWAIAVAAFIGLFALKLPFPLIIGLAALVGLVGARWGPAAFAASVPHSAWSGAHRAAVIDDDTPPPPHARGGRAALLRVLAVGLGLWVAAMLALAAGFGADALPTAMAAFFTQAALLTFGGAYAVLPYVYQGAVEQHGWLTGPQMISGLALGETTPGPLIMVVAFVGFAGGWQAPFLGGDTALASGVAAACVVTFFTFLPSFVFIFAGAPLVEHTRGNLRFTAPLTAITAAVVGVIVNLALFFAGHVFWPGGMSAAPDWVALGIASAALLALWRGWLGPIAVIALCALAGLARTAAGPLF
ncbi:MAG: chromate efflux transporter [Betaproteobacteria bacterium]